MNDIELKTNSNIFREKFPEEFKFLAEHGFQSFGQPEETKDEYSICFVRKPIIPASAELKIFVISAEQDGTWKIVFIDSENQKFIFKSDSFRRAWETATWILNDQYPEQWSFGNFYGIEEQTNE